MKYELVKTDTTQSWDGRTLYRIRRIESGELGGFSVDRQTLLYSTDGTPQSLFRGDWIVRKDAYGDRPQTVEYLSGVTVHQKREVQSWVARLRGLIKSEVTGKEFRGGVDYICTEIERLLNMPVGNAS